MKKNFLLTLCTIATSCAITGTLIYSCGSSNKNEKMQTEFKEFIKGFEAKYIPLYKEMTLTSWNANISGDDPDYKKAADAEFMCSKIFSDKADFEKLKKIKESGAITDSIEKRELELLYKFL